MLCTPGLFSTTLHQPALGVQRKNCTFDHKLHLHGTPPTPENLPDEKSRSVGLMTVDHYFDSWWLNIPNLYSVSAPDLWRGPNCMLVTALLYKSTYFDFDDCQVPHWGA